MTITVEISVSKNGDYETKTVTFEDITAENIGSVAALIERLVTAWTE